MVGRGILSVRGNRRGANAMRRRQASDPAAAVSGAFAVYSAGGWTFTAPAAGVYEFAGWSPGYSSYNNQASVSGSFALKRMALHQGEQVAIVVGQAAAFMGSAAIGANSATSVTFPNGSALSMGLGDPTASTAAVASGGDVNINGNVSSGGAQGAVAPSYGDYRGGAVSATGGVANAPGGGAPYRSTGATGGDGLVLVRQVS